jgi:hypothetical protein
MLIVIPIALGHCVYEYRLPFLIVLYYVNTSSQSLCFLNHEYLLPFLIFLLSCYEYPFRLRMLIEMPIVLGHCVIYEYRLLFLIVLYYVNTSSQSLCFLNHENLLPSLIFLMSCNKYLHSLSFKPRSPLQNLHLSGPHIKVCNFQKNLFFFVKGIETQAQIMFVYF